MAACFNARYLIILFTNISNANKAKGRNIVIIMCFSFQWDADLWKGRTPAPGPAETIIARPSHNCLVSIDNFVTSHECLSYNFISSTDS